MAAPRGLLQIIIRAAAERLAQDACIPAANREAFRASAVAIFEQQVSAIIGSDTLRISGWAMPPSARHDRRERILASLAAGEPARQIAARELVSERWVRRLRSEAERAGGSFPP
jgi:hypothetical protein